MSNIYIQEPPTSGKVLLRTSVGDIDVELWAREAPKACRNFIQLCLEGYYDNTIFHRVVKGFIVQGGDPTGTGEGGESVYGEPFKDEFHSRLRFNRRGLAAMANAGKDDNGSQFFFTLGAAPELQNKHTIFGKVVGDTLYNMLKLAEGLVDGDERPVYPQKILSTEVLTNPFPDIVPRAKSKTSEEGDERRKKKEKRAAVKNFKLLSFGEEAEEDEEASTEVSRKLAAGRVGKSAHDMLQTPELSAVPAVGEEEKKLSGDEEDDIIGPTIDTDAVRNKLSKKTVVVDSVKPSSSREPFKRPAPVKPERKRSGKKDAIRERREKEREKAASSSEEEEEEEEASRAKLKRLKEEYEQLRAQLKAEKRRTTEEAKEREKEEKEREEKEGEKKEKTEMLVELEATQEKYKKMKAQIPKKGPSRENFTLQLLARFQEKLHSAKDAVRESEELSEDGKDKAKEEEGALEDVDDDDPNDTSWLTHKLEFNKNEPVLAKDASTKSDDWFEIYDPRNPINKRRRAEGEKGKEKEHQRPQQQQQQRPRQPDPRGDRRDYRDQRDPRDYKDHKEHRSHQRDYRDYRDKGGRGESSRGKERR